MEKDGEQNGKRRRTNKEMKGKSKFVIALVYFVDSTLTSELTVIIREFWDLVHLGCVDTRVPN